VIRTGANSYRLQTRQSQEFIQCALGGVEGEGGCSEGEGDIHDLVAPGTSEAGEDAISSESKDVATVLNDDFDELGENRLGKVDHGFG